jgi:hypothetical protein
MSFNHAILPVLHHRFFPSHLARHLVVQVSAALLAVSAHCDPSTVAVQFQLYNQSCDSMPVTWEAFVGLNGNAYPAGTGALVLGPRQIVSQLAGVVVPAGNTAGNFWVNVDGFGVYQLPGTIVLGPLCTNLPPVMTTNVAVKVLFLRYRKADGTIGRTIRLYKKEVVQ